MVKILQEAQRATHRAPEYNVPLYFRNQTGRPVLFTDIPEKYKLGRGRWELESCQILLNSVHRFQRRSRKCISQLEAWSAMLFYRSPPCKLGRGRWDLATCQVLLNSVQRFQRRSNKFLSQSEARAAILFFQSAWTPQTWQRTLRSCFLLSFT